MTRNADQWTYWNETAGPKWVANQAQMDRMIAPLTEALLQEAVPAPGEHVLDIGCGCGDIALKIAEAVGPDGRVVGLDLSRPMLARARERSAGSQWIEWREADAMTAAFEPTFDLLVSRFGVMFFEDKAHAFANLRTAAKPGGRLAWLTWRGRAEVEWMQAPLDWIESAIPMPPSADGEAGPFGLADGEATRRLLEDVGFRDVIAEPVDRTLCLGDSVEAAYLRLLDNGPAAAAIRDADEPAREEAKALLRRGVERQAKDGRVEMRGACWIYRGVL